MQSLQGPRKNTPNSLTKTFMKVQGGACLTYGSVFYNQQHNMIIACPSNQTIQFYDATTLKPLKERQILKLNGDVMSLSFQPETETYLIGCTSGSIYQYNASKDELKLLKAYDSPILRVTFLSSSFYAFSMLHSKNLHVGSLDDDKITLTYDLRNSDSFCLYHLARKALLFSGQSNGSVRISRTNKLPEMKVAYSARTGGWVLTIQSINVNGKEYVVTSGRDQNVKIWHLVKGQMRLVRVIPNEGMAFSVVYLENYKMIAVTERSRYMIFFSFVTGKLVRSVDLGSRDEHRMFLMKDKNTIGVTSKNGSFIELLKLSP